MSGNPAVDRRKFLKGAVVTGAAALVPDAAANAAPDAASQAAPVQGTGPTMPPVGVRDVDPAVAVGAGPAGRPGSDFMLDVLKSLDFEYVASNAGSSFRGIHESIINYGNNQLPEFLTCCHEESSVAMAHGYYKAEGKPTQSDGQRATAAGNRRRSRRTSADGPTRSERLVGLVRT